jgi:Asp-tRNA(Asn)/Glu-tRNA(Gln) amidotransferase C subunit
MPLRGDEASPSLDRDLVLAEAPRAVDGGFAVPTFVDEG